MPTYSFIHGFEYGLTTNTGPNGDYIQGTYKRSGSYALRLTSTASVSASQALSFRPAGGGQHLIFYALRFYLLVLSLPAATKRLSFHGTFSIYMNSSGNLSFASGSGFGTTPITADGQWHKIDVHWISASGWRIFVDDVSVGATDSATDSGATGSTTFGSSETIAADFVIDDLMASSDKHDDVLFPSGKCLLLLPVADSSRGTWTAGAGGTANLYAAIDNQPPNGLAVPTDASQITNVDKNANQDTVFTCQSYSAAGLTDSDTINAVQAVCVSGEQVSTGTKAGGVWIASNPAQSDGGDTFDFGDDVGGLGNFPTNWKQHKGPLGASPSVTISNSPTLTIRKTTATSRATDICFAGIHVDYNPGSVPADPLGMMGFFGI